MSKVDFQKICRLCTKSRLSLISLHDFDEDGISSEEKLKISFGIKINSEDVLPKNICKQCRTKLKNSYEFRNLCFSSIPILEKYLETNENPKWTEEYLEEEFENEDIPEVTETLYYLKVDDDSFTEKKNSINFTDIKPYFDYKDLIDVNNENMEHISEIDYVTFEEYLENDFDDSNLNYNENNDINLESISNSNTIQENTTNKNLKPKNVRKTKSHSYKRYSDKKYEYDPSKKFKCKVCKKRFNAELKVKLHMQRIHTEIYLEQCNATCHICGMKFQQIRNLKRHLVYHNIKYSYFACSFCSQKFYSKKSWRQHIRKHDTKINEICKLCNKTIYSSVAKIYHMDFHRTKRSVANKTFYNCINCNVDFIKFEDLEDHVSELHLEILEEHNTENIKTSEKSVTQHFDEVERNFERIFSDSTVPEINSFTNIIENSLNENANGIKTEKTNSDLINVSTVTFKCNLCSIYYKNLPELKFHVTECFSKIDKPKAFMCDTCGKCFKTSWLLNNHKRGHSSARKFICDICGQRFKWHNDLSNHKNRIHDNIRPYVCKYCGKTCATSATLKSHLRSHSKEKPFSCNICNSSFAQNNSLKEHMFKHTGGEEEACPVCNKIFRTPLRLRTHMKRHNSQRKLYPCDICGRMFTEKNTVKKHRFNIHNYVYSK